jgi:hypothetical protein
LKTAEWILCAYKPFYMGCSSAIGSAVDIYQSLMGNPTFLRCKIMNQLCVCMYVFRIVMWIPCRINLHRKIWKVNQTANQPINLTVNRLPCIKIQKFIQIEFFFLTFWLHMPKHTKYLIKSWLRRNNHPSGFATY